MNKFVWILVAAAVPAVAFAQESWDIVWDRTYDSGDDDIVYGSVSDGAYYYFVGEYDWSDGFIMKVDSSTGDTLWLRVYGDSPYDDRFKAIIKGYSNTYWIAGETRSYDENGDYDFWLLQVDENGDSLRGYAYGGSDVDRAYDLLMDHNYRIVMVGRTHSFGAGSADIWIIRIDPDNGNLLWSHAYGGPDYDYASAVALDSSGHYVVVGRKHNGSNFDGWILKVDTSTGDTLWSKIMGTISDYEAFRDVMVDPDGNYVIVGYEKSYTPDRDMWIVKLSPSGGLIWQKFYDVDGSDYAYSVAYDPSGYYVVSGVSNTDGVIAKIDPSTGDTLWIRRYIEGDGIYDPLFTVMVDGNGNYVAGGLRSNSTWDAWILKIYGITDMVPPVIDSLTQLPRDADGSFGPYEVWAWVMDNRTGISNALLHWKRSTQPAFFVDTMAHVSGNWYMGTIPQQPVPSDSVEVLYFVSAEDGMGNVSSSDTLSFWIVNPAVSGDEVSGQGLSIRDIDGGVRIIFEVPREVPVSMSIYSTTGRKVYHFRDRVSGRLSRDVRLVPGIYLMRGYIGEDKFERKIIRVR